MISLDILETESSFHRKVIVAICEEMNVKLSKISLAIKNDIAKNIKPVFTETEEYKLMMRDEDIRADLGLPRDRREIILDSILQKIADNIEVTFSKFWATNYDIHGGFDIGIVLSDYSDILALPDAVIKSKNGLNDWLRWLLLAGNEVILGDYHVEYRTGEGRSTFGIMEKGGQFMMDNRIAGTQSNNWLTNAVKNNENMLKTIIINAAQKQIERLL